MKILSFEISDYPPIKTARIENLGSMVIIAGANGSGKSRLKQAVVETLQGNPQMNMVLGATRSEEETNFFGGKSLSVQKGISNHTLSNYIRGRKYARGGFVGSLVQIDSDRNIESLSYGQVNWFGGDPDENESATDFYFNPFRNRWIDFMNYIHQKLAARDKNLADAVKNNPHKSGDELLREFPDPLEKYKRIFSSVLPGKELKDLEPGSPREFYYHSDVGTPLPFSSLSSGEKEVVKVLFDVARKNIRHSVIIVDEPELHLHPTLTFKLIETLKTTGEHTNQFIFLTHSADLISTYYSTGDVYFLDAQQTGTNQAHKLSNLDHSHQGLVQLIGQNLGLFAVGKKLVFVEGENSSIDRLTYHTIAEQLNPELKFIPVGPVANLNTLSIIETEIRNSVFGIELYMIRDRDGLSSEQIAEIEKGGRIFCLKRRHIENYFLDAEVLMRVAEILYLTSTKPSLSVQLIEDEMKRSAEETLAFNLLQNTKDFLAVNRSFEIPTVKSVDSKSLEEVKEELVDGISASLAALSKGLDKESLITWLESEETRLKTLLETDGWKTDFQGKIIFAKLCTFLREDSVRVRQAYVDTALKFKPEVFDDLASVFNKL